MQLLTSEDSVGSIPLITQVEPGSSKVEPGVSPSNLIEFKFEKWSEIQNECGQSRLDGGMHFSKAIPAGEQLCSGLAALVINRTELLKTGNANGALADLDDTSITVKRHLAENMPLTTTLLPKKSKKSKKKGKSSKF